MEEKMMIEAITINYKGEQPTVSGRELYEALGIETAYKDWFPRMCVYGFTEGEDFNTLKIERIQIEGKREVKRILTDHQLTIPMAKELCMLQRNEKGKKFRQYFIKVEEMWNSPEMVMKRALDIANARVEEMKAQNSLLITTIKEQKPFVDFAKHVTESSDTVDVGEFAKIVKSENIDIGRNRLFQWLRDNKYLMSNNTPYQKYIENKFFEVIETSKETAYGSRIFTKTLITGKGQVFLVERLRKEFGAAA